MSTKKRLVSGHTLIATNRCKMIFSRTYALTIGKEYRIISTTENTIRILDDQKQDHLYSLLSNDESYWRKYFKLNKK